MQKFSPGLLFRRLRPAGRVPAYQVAYSGGMDSHVLLHAMAAAGAAHGASVSAVHVNHGLHSAADDWQRHCASVCDALGVPLTVLRVNAAAARGESPEAAARAARYRALRDWLPHGHCLLTAHHQDDQAETLLVQLLRGSGVHGLAAMPVAAPFGAGSHLRPLLDWSRPQLRAYADSNGLQWIEDPSNEDAGFTRNFLRHRILPELSRRWPSAASSIARSARHQAEAAQLLDELAQQDLAGAVDEAGTLACSALLALAPGRRRNALRNWLRSHADQVPPAAVLARMEQDLLHSRHDAGPCVRWGRHELRRYRDRLYLLEQQRQAAPHGPLEWQPGNPSRLTLASGELQAVTVVGDGVRQALLDSTGVRVGWRVGGERCRPHGRQQHTLKHLFQEAGIPPWERTRIPLIYIGDELVAVAGLWTCEPYRAAPGEPGIRFEWRPATGC